VIDTSSVLAGIAVIEDGRAVAESVHESGRTYDLPAAVRALVDPRRTDRVAVATGPGSFTGLRVGASYAVGLALGRGIPLLGFSTLDLHRARVRAEATAVCEAGRGRVYALTPEAGPMLVEAAELTGRWPVVGWLREATRDAIQGRVLEGSELASFGAAAARIVAEAVELDCARVRLEYMQSFQGLH
jgi:tRNA threonylcarbamoyl adenosine modification protein YeaZ